MLFVPPSSLGTVASGIVPGVAGGVGIPVAQIAIGPLVGQLVFFVQAAVAHYIGIADDVAECCLQRLPLLTIGIPIVSTGTVRPLSGGYAHA